MGIMHAVYGAGATVAPLVATVFVQHVDKFYLLYAVSLGLSFVNLGVLVWVFKLKNTEQLLGPAVHNPSAIGESERLDATRLQEEIVHKPENSGAKFMRIVRTPTVVFLGFFIFVYVGLEITIGG
jgi:fucose permease